jgi:hypothetical protein
MADASLPVVGEEIYVPTSFSMSHGEDDVVGGKATIVHTEQIGKYLWVSVAEHPVKRYNWEDLLENQAEWKKQYGDRRAKKDPDTRPEFNSGATATKDDIRRWLVAGKEKGATHVIVAYDMFDYLFYPTLVMPGENTCEKAEEIARCDVVKEVYSLTLDIEQQLAEHRAVHYD